MTNLPYIEKPILFKPEMVRAILEGRKTQTRRVCKVIGEGKAFAIFLDNCPYGQPGDQLWVRETFCPVHDSELGGEDWVDYRATPKYSDKHPAGWDAAPDDEEALKWRPSIHMPRKLSRLQLLVKSVRVERLQDISEEDAIAEGVQIPVSEKGHALLCVTQKRPVSGIGFVAEFAALWEQINSKRGFSWDTNPWVWVVEFGRI